MNNNHHPHRFLRIVRNSKSSFIGLRKGEDDFIDHLVAAMYIGYITDIYTIVTTEYVSSNSSSYFSGC